MRSGHSSPSAANQMSGTPRWIQDVTPRTCTTFPRCLLRFPLHCLFTSTQKIWTEETDQTFGDATASTPGVLKSVEYLVPIRRSAPPLQTLHRPKTAMLSIMSILKRI